MRAEAMKAAVRIELDRERMADGGKRGKLGLGGQIDRRRDELKVRKYMAKMLASLAAGTWRTIAAAARALGVKVRTAQNWVKSLYEGVLEARRRGRPPKTGSPEEQAGVLETLFEMGPGVGVPTLARKHKGISRAALYEQKRDFVAWYRKEYARTIRVLKWEMAGCVWCMDFGHAPGPVDGNKPYFLVVKDVPSRCMLAAAATEHMDFRAVIATLETLFLKYGKPLSIKADNGSCFDCPEVRAFLAGRGVKLMLSPVRCPRYNGCAENGIKGAKGNAEHVAFVNGRPGSWKSEDLEAAREISNRKVRSDGSTPEELFENRIAISEEQRSAFDRAYFRHEKSARESFGIPWAYALRKRERAKVDRWALRRALVECGYLSFRSRRITPDIPGGFRARIQ